jgi:hypothetical protein
VGPDEYRQLAIEIQQCSVGQDSRHETVNLTRQATCPCPWPCGMADRTHYQRHLPFQPQKNNNNVLACRAGDARACCLPCSRCHRQHDQQLALAVRMAGIKNTVVLVSTIPHGHLPLSPSDSFKYISFSSLLLSVLRPCVDRVTVYFFVPFCGGSRSVRDGHRSGLTQVSCVGYSPS